MPSDRKCPTCNERPVIAGSSRCGECDRVFFNIAEAHAGERGPDLAGEFALAHERRIRALAARAAARGPLVPHRLRFPCGTS